MPPKGGYTGRLWFFPNRERLVVVGIAYHKDGNEGEQNERAKQDRQENTQV